MLDFSPFSHEEVCVPFPPDFIQGGGLRLIAESVNAKKSLALLELDEGLELDDGEARFQLLEGQSYEYELPVGFSLKPISRVVHPSRGNNNQHRGRITPGNYVGRLALSIVCPADDTDIQHSFELAVEVRSVKANYRSEYRKMLEDITAECTSLLMQHSSPTTQQFAVDHNNKSETLYQRFAFVKALVDSDEFRNAVQRIVAMPVTQWQAQVEERDIRRAGRIGSWQLRQMASRSDRVALPSSHSLYNTLNTLPSRLATRVKIDSLDTPENRFVKHALQTFALFCSSLCDHIEYKQKQESSFPYIYHEAKALEGRFESYLSHDIFKSVQVPNTLPLNSPILQRKEGYREVLRVWLMFDLAAKLVWQAPDAESYQVGKRDVATLYEYWLFFKLLRLIEDIFNVAPTETEKLIAKTGDGLGLQLKEGKHLAIDASYHYAGRDLKVQFSYNRTFGHSQFPKSGSWTQAMRPDYTLSIWPSAFTVEQAEAQELIVHVHFDAKYKVEGLKYFLADTDTDIASNESLDNEKRLQKEGKYKRADLLKMHAYKDAIRRTVGAYVLYPGSRSIEKRGFHEVVPGLGAFPVSPSNDGDGLTEVRAFIIEVVEHLTNRASQREQLSYQKYAIHKDDSPDIVQEVMPEYTHALTPTQINRFVPPSDAGVLIAYIKDKQQLEWIKNKRLYNIRLDTKGLKKYGITEASVKYVLLRCKGEHNQAFRIWEVVGSAPKVVSKKALQSKHKYPSMPSAEAYLLYELNEVSDDAFGEGKWDLSDLIKQYAGTGAEQARPFAISLSELSKSVVKEY